jgi:hypothetical protein
MNIISISTLDARRGFGDFLNRVFYGSEQIRIQRKNKTLARLVPENIALAWDQLQKNDPGLADTIALLANKELLTGIEEGSNDYKSGKKIPLESLR